MITIKIGPKQDAKRAMQKLKNRVIAEELFVELKKRRHYLKPSARKKLKREEAAKQRKKDFNSAVRKAEAQEQEDYYS
jgi:small subunit ribosomal protein S21